MKSLLLALVFWSRPYVPVQVPELPPEERLRTAAHCVLQGKDGEAVTHLLLLAQRHPHHPAAPWARLAAAFLYERQGDFIAARVWYDKASAYFSAPASGKILQHARRLDAEIRRLPVQAMREGRQWLHRPPGPETGRAMRAFLVRFRTSPLHAEIKWRLAAESLQSGQRLEALFFLLWSAFDGHPAASERILSALRAWPAASWPFLDGIFLVLLIPWLLAMGIRLWQCGPAGPRLAGVAALVSLVVAAIVPLHAFFWPAWFFLATLRLWVVGAPAFGMRSEWFGWALFAVWSVPMCLHAAGILHL